MTEQEMRRGGGGKLARTETVTVRLDPKLRYLAELAARVHRRTLSSYIEWAIKESLDKDELRPANALATAHSDRTVGSEVANTSGTWTRPTDLRSSPCDIPNSCPTRTK